MVNMVGSSGTLDILRVKSVGFLDSLKVECERKEGNKIPSKLSVSATRRMGLPLSEKCFNREKFRRVDRGL